MSGNNDFDINTLLDVSCVPGMNPGALDMEVEVVEPVKLKEVVSNPTEPEIDLLDDYKHVRKSMIQRSELGMDLLQEVINSARQTENPKYIAAATELMKEIGSVDRDIVKFHESIQKMKAKAMDNPNGGKQTNESTNGHTGPVTISSPSSLLDDEEIADGEYTEL